MICYKNLTLVKYLSYFRIIDPEDYLSVSIKNDNLKCFCFIVKFKEFSRERITHLIKYSVEHKAFMITKWIFDNYNIEIPYETIIRCYNIAIENDCCKSIAIIDHESKIIFEQDVIKTLFYKVLSYKSYNTLMFMRHIFDNRMTQETKDEVDKKIITLTVFTENKYIAEKIATNNKNVVHVYREFIGVNKMR